MTFVSERVAAGAALRVSPPAVPAGFVRRPRIDALLSRAARGPVTLVSAGPGYGKTLSLAHWARHGDLPGPVAWLSVDASDDSLPGFWSSLLAAIHASGALPAGSGLAEIAPAARFGPAQADQVIDEIAALSTPLVVVLDDVQQLGDRDLLQTVQRWLDRRPPTVRLVLSARFDPPLRLQRLAVAGALTEIRARELAFDRAEAGKLMRASGLDLPAAALDTLTDRTRGWAAGLRLAAMGLDPRTSEAGVARLRGSDRPVAEYFLAEVLDQLSADDRRFLLHSSVADPVTADLAVALTGDPGAQRRLETFEARNAFLVGLAGGRTWFTWHPLFRELLLHQLTVEEPGMVDELHRRAAAWLEETGDHVGAIGHLSEAREWATIGRLVIERAAPDVVASGAGALADALAPAAARSRVDPTPGTLLASALRNFRRFDYDAMLRDADAAAAMASDMAGDTASDEAAVAGSADLAGTDVLVGVLRMAYARARAPHHLVEAAGRALTLVDQAPRHLVPAVERYRAIASTNLGVGLLWSGDIDSACSMLTDARQACRQWDLGLPELTALGHLAIVDAIRGRYRSARAGSEQARGIADRHGWNPEPQASAHMVALAWAALEQGDPDAADELIAVAAGVGNPDAACRAALSVLTARVALARGEIALAARRMARPSRPGVAADPTWPPLPAGWLRVTAADVELARGNPAGARRLLADRTHTGFTDALRTVTAARCLLAEDDPGGSLDLLTGRMDSLAPFASPAVEARVTASLASARLRRDRQALAWMTEAVELAVTDRVVRPFVTAGGPARALLSRHRSLVGEHQDFTATLVGPADEPDGADRPVERLTEREQSILSYLPTYMKSSDIAADLFVSVNTVKSHLQAIYRKLGAKSRQEAVRRARELGLL